MLVAVAAGAYAAGVVAQWAGVLACCLAFGTGCARPAVTAQQPAQQQQPASVAASTEPDCDARLATIPYLLKRVKARPEGAPLLPYARLVLDADGERQVAEQVARIEAHPDWHIEVALHMDLETRDEAPPELVAGLLTELARALRWPLRTIGPPDRVTYVVHGATGGPPEDPRAGSWIELLRRCGPFPPDRDHDAIGDLADRCIDSPEDHDRFEDEDGCPDHDNDGDGFLDAHTWTGTRWTNCDGQLVNGVEIDCRDRPESLDCVEDNDGCPEGFGWHHDAQLPVIHNAPLDSRTLWIPAGSLAQLDAVVTHAAAHPQERYWVEVHVGRRRTRKEAKMISGRLAAAIVAELVHRGVASTRLEPIGYGDERPLYDDRRPERLRENYRFHVTPHGRPDCRVAPAPLCR